MEAKFRSGPNKNIGYQRFSGSQISSIWPPEGQSGRPVTKDKNETKTKSIEEISLPSCLIIVNFYPYTDSKISPTAGWANFNHLQFRPF